MISRRLFIAFSAGCIACRHAAGQAPAKEAEFTAEQEKEFLRLLGADYPKALPLWADQLIQSVHHKSVGANRYGGAVSILLKDNGLTDYRTIHDRIDAYQVVYEVGHRLVDTVDKSRKLYGVALDIGGAVAKTPVSSIAVKAGKYANDAVHDALDSMASRVMDDGVSQGLKPNQTAAALRTFARLAVDQSNPAGLDAARKFFDDSFVSNPAFKALKPEQEIALIKAMQGKIIEFGDRLEAKVDLIGSRVGLSSDEIAKHITNINGIVKTTQEFKDRQQKFAERMATHQTEVNSRLSKVESRVRSNTQEIERLSAETARQGELTAANRADLDFLKSAMYDKLPTKDKLDWMKSGFYELPPGIKEAELARQERIAVVEAQVKFADDLRSHLQGASQVLTFAQSVGVDPKIVAVGQEIVTRGSAAADVFKSVASGNWLGAVGALGSLIFGGGPDVAELRHREVMKALGVIDEKIDKVLANQKAILETLNALDAKVERLTEIVVRQHLEVMEKLYEINYNVLYNRRILIEVLEQDTNLCRTFVRNMVAIDEASGTEQEKYARKVASFRAYPLPDRNLLRSNTLFVERGKRVRHNELPISRPIRSGKNGRNRIRISGWRDRDAPLTRRGKLTAL
jgi:hypothetical protein